MGVNIINNGRIRDSEDVSLADYLLTLRKNKDPWDVIEALVAVWGKKAPLEVKAMKIQIEEYRDMLADKKFGQTKGGKDFQRRFTIAFPYDLMMLIRTQYQPTELIMDSAFYKEFARRFPSFQIPDKL